MMCDILYREPWEYRTRKADSRHLAVGLVSSVEVTFLKCLHSFSGRFWVCLLILEVVRVWMRWGGSYSVLWGKVTQKKKNFSQQNTKKLGWESKIDTDAILF